MEPVKFPDYPYAAGIGATLDGMGYRGEDSARDRAAWGTQSPRQSSSGQWPVSDEYGNSTDHAGYDGNRHAGDSGYAADDNYAGYDGYGRGTDHGPDGYGTGGSGTGGYSADRHGSGGYPAVSDRDTGGYGTGGYGTNGYSTDRYGSGGYPAVSGRDTGGHPAPGYNSAPTGDYNRSGGYPNLGGPSGSYPTLGRPSGGYPAITSRQVDNLPDAYSDGNDWYANGNAAHGAGFADTSTQIAAIRDPSRGYPPEPALPEAGVARTGQQLRYDESEYVSYPGYDQVEDEAHGYGGRRGYDYDDYAAAGPREYEPRLDQPAVDYDSPRGYGQALQGDDFDGGLYRDDYRDDDVLASPADGRRGDRGGQAGGPGTGPRMPPTAGGPKPKRGGRKVLVWTLVLILVGAAGFGGYKFLMKPKANSAADVTKPLPTTSASASAATAQCVAQFGQFCHIQTRALDPAPLVVDDVFPPAFFSETAKAQFIRASAAEDKDCSKGVIGTDLVTQLKKGDCNQVLRATYLSGDGTIMGTIGVINLTSTNQAHYAGKIIGKANFIMPLAGTKGPTAKLGKGTGVVEAQYKGHYLILIWAEFVNQKTPSTAALTQQLENFENALVAGTANIVLSQRMINGDGPAASASPTASASKTATATPTATAS